jgi:hypothetical protein
LQLWHFKGGLQCYKKEQVRCYESKIVILLALYLGAIVYCPEECNPDEQECIVLYNGIDHYNSTVIQGDRNAPKVGNGNGA